MNWQINVFLLAIAALGWFFAWWMQVLWQEEANNHELTRQQSVAMISSYAQAMTENAELRQVNIDNATAVERSLHLQEHCVEILKQNFLLQQENAYLRRRTHFIIYPN